MANIVGPTLLCVPLVAKTVEQMLSDMAAAKASGADIVEIRLDHLTAFRPRPDLEVLLGNRPLPALVTYRTVLLHPLMAAPSTLCRLIADKLNAPSRPLGSCLCTCEMTSEIKPS